jgi:hypothetical protein
MLKIQAHAVLLLALSSSLHAKATPQETLDWTEFHVCGDRALTMDLIEYLPSAEATTLVRREQLVIHDLELAKQLRASLEAQAPGLLARFNSDPFGNGEYLLPSSPIGRWDREALLQGYVHPTQDDPQGTTSLTYKVRVLENNQLRLSWHLFSNGGAGSRPGEREEIANFIFNDCYAW